MPAQSAPESLCALRRSTPVCDCQATVPVRQASTPSPEYDDGRARATDRARRCVEVADSERSDLARALESRKGIQRFGKRDGATPVQQVQVDALDAEAAQASVAGGNRAALCRVVRVDFADQEHFPAPAANRFAG